MSASLSENLLGIVYNSAILISFWAGTQRKKALSSKNLLPTVNNLNVCEVSGFS